MELKVKRMKRTDGIRESFYLPAAFRGLRLTVKHFFRNLFGSRDVVTFSYPEVKRPVSIRWRGRHRLTRKEDGFLKCVACYMCETICPAKCIHIDAGEHPDLSIEKYPVRFDIDELRCIYCGMCEEACPVDVIELTPRYEVVGLSRQETIFDKEKLLEIYDATIDEKPM